MEQKEIFEEIVLALKDNLNGENFLRVVLEIKRLEGNVGFTGYYFDKSEEKRWLDIFNLKIESDLIQKLYQLTQNSFPIHKNWNRAKFILLPENKFEIEYFWDQELQDEVDRFNK